MSSAEQEPVRAELSAIGQAMAILGDRWVLLILQRAFLLRIRTFAGWRDALGISESVLASRLKELVNHGIFELAAYRNGRTRYEYRLTGRGLRLWSLLVAIYAWERDWADRGHPQPLHHDLCGEDAKPYLGCGACLAPMSVRDTRTEPGPSAVFSQIGPPRRHRRTVRSGADPDLIGYCPDSMEILGDRWSTSVLAAAFLGIRRFVDFQSGSRHRALGAHRPPAPLRRARRLRPSSRRLLPAHRQGPGLLRGLRLPGRLGPARAPRTRGSGPFITHGLCGAAFDPVLLCTACGRPLRRQEVRFILSGEKR